MIGDEQDELLLDRLHEYGQEFLSSFSLPAATHKKRKQPEECDSPIHKAAKIDEEEWLGFGEQDSEASNENDDTIEGITQL
jgi:hypothetical protein